MSHSQPSTFQRRNTNTVPEICEEVEPREHQHVVARYEVNINRENEAHDQNPNNREEEKLQAMFDTMIDKGLGASFAILCVIFALKKSSEKFSNNPDTVAALTGFAIGAFLLFFLSAMLGRRTKFARLLILIGVFCCYVMTSIATSQIFWSMNKHLIIVIVSLVYAAILFLSYKYGNLKQGLGGTAATDA